MFMLNNAIPPRNSCYPSFLSLSDCSNKQQTNHPPGGKRQTTDSPQPLEVCYCFLQMAQESAQKR